MSKKVHREEVYRTQADNVDAVAVTESPAAQIGAIQHPEDGNDVMLDDQPLTSLCIEPAPSCELLDQDEELLEPNDAGDVCGRSDAPLLPVFRIDERLLDRTTRRDYFDGWEVALACHEARFSVIPLRGLRHQKIILADMRQADDYVTAVVTPFNGKVVARRLTLDGIELISWTQRSEHGSYKSPACPGWQTLPFDLAWWEPRSRIQVGDRSYWGSDLRLVGIRTGDGLVVVDIDTKDGKNGFSALFERFGERVLELFPATFSVITPSGGMHLYYRAPARVGNAPLVTGVDIRGDGGLVVAPGSIGVNGRRYEITNLLEPALLPTETLRILHAISTQPQYSANDVGDEAEWSDVPIAERRKRASKYLAKMPEAVQGKNGSGACFKAAIAMARGFALPAEEALDLLLGEYNSRCQPPWSDDELRHKIDDALTKGSIPMGALIKRKKASTKTIPLPPAGITGASWEQALVRSEFGKIQSWSANVDTILVNDAPWTGVLGFDELLNNVTFLAPPPADFLVRRAGDEWKDEDDIAFCNSLQRKWNICVSPVLAHATIVLAARRRTFHPIREELVDAVWDGVPRIGEWLSTYLGVSSTDYSRRVGAWWLISAIARVMQPGCKVDTMLILEGPQGARKSSALRVLAGDKYFLDDLGDVGGVEAKKQLRGKWIVEMAELDALRRAEASTIKQFLSRQSDNYRPSYGRAAMDFPRQCVFAGTTNHDEYLHDETGARRFWPVKVGEIDLKALARDRTQLWAEALQRFEAGERYWPEGSDELGLFTVEQDARETEDDWTQSIVSYVAALREVSTADILISGLGFEHSRIRQTDTKRVAAVLRKLGWDRGRGNATHPLGTQKRKQPRVYVRGPNAAPPQTPSAAPSKVDPLRAADFASRIPIFHLVDGAKVTDSVKATGHKDTNGVLDLGDFTAHLK